LQTAEAPWRSLKPAPRLTANATWELDIMRHSLNDTANDSQHDIWNDVLADPPPATAPFFAEFLWRNISSTARAQAAVVGEKIRPAHVSSSRL
jgi:hypothetical protein